MTPITTRHIELQEYDELLLDRCGLSGEAAETLWRQYGNQVEVEYPSPKTGDRWRLRSKGWVGYIPVGDAFHLALRPKTPVYNIFRMLEYAYNLESFRFLEGEATADTLEEIYEHLAHVLSKRVLNRARRGFYKAYLPQAERLPYVRGRIDMRRVARRPWSVQPHCHYHEITLDVEENRLLAWTLFLVGRMPLDRPEVRASVQQAFRALRGSVRLEPFGPDDCTGRTYSRLNQDYEALHALCRFFLEHTGPTVKAGDRNMLPFLVDMAQLFEKFVGAWLDKNLSSGWRLERQERYRLGDHSHFNIDLVLYRALDGSVEAVLDTKYKVPEQPSMTDVQQVTAYAEAKGCKQAYLVYPAPLPEPFDETVGDIRVQSVVFSIGKDLQEAGCELQRQVLQ